MKPQTMEELERLRKNGQGKTIPGPVNKGPVRSSPIPVQIVPKAEKIQKILEQPGKNFYRR